MAVKNYSTENTVLVINGRQITDFGETDPPMSSSPIDPKTSLRRGLGGSAVRLDRINPGRAFSLYLNPGTPDSSFVQGLMNTQANITLGLMVIGTLEVVAASEGVIVNDGTTGRGGATISDDQFDFEFNIWEETKGADS